MSFKIEWGLNQKVITPRGVGEVVSIEDWGICEVKLKEGGRREFEIEEVVLDSDYTVVRIINLGLGLNPGMNGLEMKLLANAKNHPNWGEAKKALELYATNETLIALNFEERRFESNRILKGGIAPSLPEGDANYHLIQAYFNNYWPMKEIFFEAEEETRKAWEEIEKYGATSEWIWLNALLDLEKNRILGQAIFCPVGVIRRKTW